MNRIKLISVILGLGVMSVTLAQYGGGMSGTINGTPETIHQPQQGPPVARPQPNGEPVVPGATVSPSPSLTPSSY